MANSFFSATVLIGGGTGALDAINGTLLSDGDAAMVQTDGTVYFYHLDAASGAAESSPDIISPDTNAGTKRWIKQVVSGGGSVPDYIRLHDSKASGTAGGTFTTGAWQKRTCTEDVDAGGHCSVASSVITLAAGTYDCDIKCHAFYVRRHRARLRNTTDGVTTLNGLNAYATDNNNGANHSTITGRFTIATAKDFEIQHRNTYTKTTNGFGLDVGTGEDEVYLVAEFKKVA